MRLPELGEIFYEVRAGERRYLTPPEARVVIPQGGIGALAWEVCAGSGWSDKSDVYSTGHLLFRLLTGKVPVKGADPSTSPPGPREREAPPTSRRPS